MACSSVVVLNRRVQLRATVSTSGVLAEEKRRVGGAEVRGCEEPADGRERHRAGRRQQSPDVATRPHQLWFDRGVGECARWCDSGSAASGGENSEQRRRNCAADHRCGGQPIRSEHEVLRGDAVVHKRVSQPSPEQHPLARCRLPSR
jgi:hypothetical protein